MIVPEKSPSWKLPLWGAEALTDGIAGDSNGDSGVDGSLHTTHTQTPPTFAVSTRKHDVRRKASTDGRISGYYLKPLFERDSTKGETQGFVAPCGRLEEVC
jgi:hypothetical protein